MQFVCKQKRVTRNISRNSLIYKVGPAGIEPATV